VEVIERVWQTSRTRLPNVKTYRLRPGESWFDAPSTEKQWQHYVARNDGKFVPVEAAITAELISEGATLACFVELWAGRCVVVNHELVCIEPEGQLAEIIQAIRDNNENRLGGFPDVVALFPDGRIAFREAKCASSKDRLGKGQHKMADLLRKLFTPQLDLKVVEWSFKLPPGE